MAQFATINQATEILNVSRLTIHRKIKAGEIPSVHLGKRVLIPNEFFLQLRDKAVGKISQKRPEGKIQASTSKAGA